MKKPFSMNINVSHEFELELTGTVYPYVPAKISGPPENCYPAEGGNAEDVSLELTTEQNAEVAKLFEYYKNSAGLKDFSGLVYDILQVLDPKFGDFDEQFFDKVKEESEDAKWDDADRRYDEMKDREWEEKYDKKEYKDE